MTATCTILCGPAGAGKTRRLLDRWREVAAVAWGAALWLLPSRRAADDLRPHLLGSLTHALAPQLFTFQEFADELVRTNDPNGRPLSRVQRRLLLDDIVAELHADKALSHFHRVADTRGFGEGVSALLAELKRREIRPAVFARAAYRRGYDGPHVAATRNWHRVSAKDRQCARIYARYQSRLRHLHRQDPEGRLWQARDLLQRGVLPPFGAVRAVFVDGFTDFTPTQRDLLAALAEVVEEFWLTLPGEPGDERAELFARPRETLALLEPLRPRVEWLERSNVDAPAGLRHLERHLFRPARSVEASVDAAGLECIEAPGLLGEARLVARRVKALLLEGTAADDVVLAVRDLQPYAGLLAEVFAEYGLPVDIEGTEPLLADPAVATLLRAVRLREEDWPFAGVTALLRSGYFRPDWPEAHASPVLPQHAEVLLRLLGEPRDRSAYLEAVRRWDENPPPGLEDEQAEESRRRRTHELARMCRAFLERFFRAWDGAPHRATPTAHVAWLRRFALDLGLAVAAGEAPRDRAALDRLWAELDAWRTLDRQAHHGERTVERKDFLRRLAALCAEAGLARTPRGPGRVRVLSAPLARSLEVPYLFVLGLGERGFPRLAPPEPIFDEAERQSFRQAGVDFTSSGDQMPDEMLLFYGLLTRARRRLVLSYPAVDERGQALLPSTFLTAALACFEPGAVSTERRRMLIEGYERDEPLSPAEQRVRAARTTGGAAGPLAAAALPPDLAANLAAAADLARARFDAPDFTPYDGLLRHPATAAEVARLFRPERVISPTALECYISCPFQFFLRHVLRLEPLEEPREEIESTRRGQAFHRALSRLHLSLREAGVHEPTEAVDDAVLGRLHEAVLEYVARAPSPASKELWRLEGQRLLRAAARYRRHWEKFVAPWAEHGVRPRPAHFEVDFGMAKTDTAAAGALVLRGAEGDEVRIGGRIDRVDVAELTDGLGFWIIDYKTGSGTHYTASDLREFRKLQLTLYALAVERVFFAGRPARPLGLAYWLVTESGPKPVLPGGRQATAWLGGPGEWEKVRTVLEGWVTELLAAIRTGTFPLKPRSPHCSATCDYDQVCRISQCRGAAEEKAWRLPLPVIP